MLAEVDARLIVTTSEHHGLADQLGKQLKVVDLDDLGQRFPSDPPGVAVGPDSLAYIFYTSGSTGKPKGVFDNHRNVLHNVLRYTNTLHIASTDRLSLLQSCSFSGTVSSLFSALLNGGAVCPINIRGVGPSDLARWITRQEITIYHSVPALFRSFLEGDQHFPAVRLVRLEGDQASRIDFELFRKYFSPACLLVNGLGTTETGIASQLFLDRESTFESAHIPIGHATPDVELLLLDDDGQPLARGNVGELGVQSNFLALGYWKNPGLTQTAFTSSTPGGRRLYRTGDRARFGSDGGFEYLGRDDFRIKIRGQTVEAAEIESALTALSTVKNALLGAREDPRGERHLVAYIIPSPGANPTVAQIRAELLGVLPGFMVPAHYVFLEEFPYTSNDKVDRRNLPSPEWATARMDRGRRPPRSLLESQLVEVWEKILDVRSIGVTDDFFELGGHSLLAASMLEHVELMYGKRIPPSFLLEGATVERVAQALTSLSVGPGLPAVEIRRGSVGPPFFFLHGDYKSGGFYSLNLSRFLNGDESFYALPPQHTDVSTFPRTFEAMSTAHIEALQRLWQAGPYFLGGLCNGGHVAFEMARSLEARGHEVGLLVIVRATAKNIRHVGMWRALKSLGTLSARNGEWQREWFQRWRWFVDNLEKRPDHERPTFVLEQIRRLADRWNASPSRSSNSDLVPAQVARQETAGTQAHTIADFDAPYRYLEDTFVPRKYPGRITLFWPEDDEEKPEDAASSWSKVAREVELHVVPGDHITCITKYSPVLARELQTCLTKARLGLNGGN
jgi:acyl-coenzyme A synthetase/AMP-(fatty) acid ligase/thioesterase domain-containing protein